MVVGKALVDEAHEHAVILLSAQIASEPDQMSRYWFAESLAHECGHLVYGAVRHQAIGDPDDVSLPWEVAGRIAMIAAEENRVDEIAKLVAGAAVTATDSAGNRLDLGSLAADRYLSNFELSLDALVPGLTDVVEAYRRWEIPMESMWGQVVRRSEELLILCAHTQAHAGCAESVVSQFADHPAQPLVAAVWNDLYQHLQSTGLLPGTEEFAADRRRLDEFGRSGFDAMWGLLGLTVTPAGDGFHLAVEQPQV